MPDYKENALNEEMLERLAFERSIEDYYSDIDDKVKIYELLGNRGYQQFVYDDENNKLSVGIPLKTVNDLQLRYKSMTGYDLRYHTGDLPIKAQ